MSEYIKREDAEKVIGQYLTKLISPDKDIEDIIIALNYVEAKNLLADIPSADVVDRERYDRVMMNFKILSEGYDELLEELERAEMRCSDNE